MKIFFTLLLAGVLLFAHAPSARADQPPLYIYRAEDDLNYQIHPQEGPDNFDNCVDGWWWTGQALEWNSYSNMRDDVITVINNWHTAIDYLPYHESLSQPAAKLLFFYVTDPCDVATIAGCNRIMNTAYDDVRKAEYIETAYINVNSLVVPSPSGPLTRAVLAHELGHQYGLGERYSTNIIGETICTTYEGTVMNSLDPYNPNVPGCPWREGPTELDKYRVGMFWRGGDPNRTGELRGDQLILGNGDGSVAMFRWQDMAWAEFKHLLKFYYWDTALTPPQWTYVTEYEIYAFSGAHLYTEPRTIALPFYREQWGKPPGYYRACIEAWFQPSQSYGNDRCSNDVTLQ